MRRVRAWPDISHPDVRHALFFGLYPDREAAGRVRGLALDEGLRPSERPHVSLVGLGEGRQPPPQSWIDKVTSAASRIRRPPFLLEFDSLCSLGRNRRDQWPIVLCGEDGVIGVSLLCEALLSALAAEGLGGRPAQIPHMTASWSGRPVEERRIEPVRWTARELLLIDSLQGAGRHELLGRWPLQGEGADASKSRPGGN